MSKTFSKIPVTGQVGVDLTLTTFFGGMKHGKMLALIQTSPTDGYGCIHLTKDDVPRLITELNQFMDQEGS